MILLANLKDRMAMKALNEIKIHIATILLGCAFLLPSYEASANDTYTGRIVFKTPSKAGVLLTVNKEVEGRLILQRNNKTILHLPVEFSELGVGLTAGLKFSGESYSILEVKGLHGDLRISDFFSTFKGTNLGATFTVPGPCCLNINKEHTVLENDKRIQFKGQGQSAGWMVELSKVLLKLSPSEKYGNRIKVADRSLAELPELKYQDEGRRELLSLECKDIQGEVTYYIKQNQFNELDVKSIGNAFLGLLSSSSSHPLQTSISKSTLHLYPEKVSGKVKGLRFDVDLESEGLNDKPDFWGRKYTYQGLVISADSAANLTCLSQSSLKQNPEKFNLYYQSLWE